MNQSWVMAISSVSAIKKERRTRSPLPNAPAKAHERTAPGPTPLLARGVVQGTASFIRSLAAQFGGLLEKQFLTHARQSGCQRGPRSATVNALLLLWCRKLRMAGKI